MINLYEENESNFNHNAYVLNEVLKVETEEEINTGFNTNILYPVNDNKDISSMLVPGAIVKIPTWDKRENQLFVIRRSKPSLDNMNIDIFAQHILTTRLENNVVLDTNIVGKIRKEAVAQVLNNTLNKHNFTTSNKDTNTITNNLRIVRYSALDALIGNKNNTIVNRYGGELEFNNFEVNIIDSIGEDKGINVTYTKNITGAIMTLENTDLITEIVPLGKDGLMLPEKSIKASNFNSHNPFTRIVEFSNIGVVEAETDSGGNITNSDEIITTEQAYKLLRQACLDKFNKEHVNQVSFNLDLDFVELTDCINFDDNDYSNMDSRVAIGDIINVNIKPFGIVEKGRVYKIKRDAITGKLLGCEVGYKIRSLTDTINSTNNK
ncbi:phage tail spike protein, partial [Clostridium sp. CMCC3678]|uniref:phage tail spike protein n=2 Tax=Clostridium TaxID=1485 RepID=UPI002079CF77